MRGGKRGRRRRDDHAGRGAAAGRQRPVARRDARGRVGGSRLVREGVFRCEGRRAAGSPPQGERHRVQPRTEREDRPGRPARHPDHRVGREASLRRELARRIAHPRFPVPVRAAQAQAGAVVPVEGALRPAHRHRAARRPPAVRSPDQARADVRLRRRHVHARGRTVHAALLPHGHGRLAAERVAAAAVPRGHPHRDTRLPARSIHASRCATNISKRSARSCSRARRRRCSRSSCCCSRTPRSRVSARRPSARSTRTCG